MLPGVVGLFADMTCEVARGITGPYPALPGTGAMIWRHGEPLYRYG